MYVLPNARKPLTDATLPWSEAGYSIPSVSTVEVNVTTYSAVGNGTTDDTTAFKNAINAGVWQASTPKLLMVPAGTFLITDTLDLPSGCVLRGLGSNSTTLKFNLSNVGDKSCLRIRSDQSLSALVSSAVAVASGYTKGSKSIVVADGSSFVVGDMVVMWQTNDDSVHCTDPAFCRPYVEWADNIISAVDILAAKDGNTLTLTHELPITFSASLNPKIGRITSRRENAGVEKVHITREDGPLNDVGWCASVFLQWVYHCWIQKCEISYASDTSILTTHALNCDFRQNFCHHAHRYGGNEGYAFNAHQRTTRCRWEDNCTYWLNAIVPSLGSYGNIFSYNYLRNAYDTRPPEWYSVYIGDFHGHYAHLNLIEGNVMDDYFYVGGYWGPCPNNTFFRNRFRTSWLSVEDHSYFCSVIGNELNSAAGAINTDTSVTYVFKHGNEVQGNITWAAGEDQDLPDSFIYGSKPTWWGSSTWPAVGPDVSGELPIPAETRYFSCAKVPQT